MAEDDTKRQAILALIDDTTPPDRMLTQAVTLAIDEGLSLLAIIELVEELERRTGLTLHPRFKNPT
jgi:hypothetical protein